MGHLASELTDGLHFLHLQHLLFEVIVVGEDEDGVAAYLDPVSELQRLQFLDRQPVDPRPVATLHVLDGPVSRRQPGDPGVITGHIHGFQTDPAVVVASDHHRVAETIHPAGVRAGEGYQPNPVGLGWHLPGYEAGLGNLGIVRSTHTEPPPLLNMVKKDTFSTGADYLPTFRLSSISFDR